MSVFGGKKTGVVEKAGTPVEGERDIPHVNDRPGGGSKKSKTLGGLAFILAALLLGGYLAIHFYNQNKASVAEKPTGSATQQKTARTFVAPPETPALPKQPKKQTLPETPQAQPIPVQAPPVVVTLPPPQTSGKKDVDPVALLEADREKSALMVKRPSKQDGGDSASLTGTRQAAGREGGLGDELKATVIPSRKAGKLMDRTFLLSRNTYITCVLETRIVTTVAGMTSCRVIDDVYSDNGKMKLIERGSRVSGEYASGQLKQGQAVIFVLWNRVTTPNGITIPLDSPGTDALGASGLGGYIDNHFWGRFGGAIMLSLIGDLSDYVRNSGSNGSNNVNVAGNSAATANDMAAEALRNTINIPPTLTKNQGEVISITVARDMDFREVYTVEAN